MSAIHDVIDLRHREPLDESDQQRAHGAAPQGGAQVEKDAHLLRLSLDLQLDALLFTLGAAAAHEPPPSPDDADLREPGVVDLRSADGEFSPLQERARSVSGEGSALPWRRWLEEDLELTTTLAATALALDSALPPALGTAATQEDPVEAAENLLARYESMCGLLTDLVEREERTAAAEVPVWQPHVRHALLRCSARVQELQRHIEAVTRSGMSRPTVIAPAMSTVSASQPLAPAAAVRRPAHVVWPQSARTPSDASGHRYLPGELLG